MRLSPSAQVSAATNGDTQPAKDQTVIAFAEDCAKKQYEPAYNDFQQGIVLASQDEWYLVKINCTNSYNQAKQETYLILKASHFVYDVDGNLTADIIYNKNIQIYPRGFDIFQTTFILSCGWTSFNDSCRRALPNSNNTVNEKNQSQLNSSTKDKVMPITVDDTNSNKVGLAKQVFNEYVSSQQHSKGYSYLVAGKYIYNDIEYIVMQAGTPDSMNGYYLIDNTSKQDDKYLYPQVYTAGWGGIQIGSMTLVYSTKLPKP